MNANELADLYDAPYEYPEWGSKAQAMLRAQQEKLTKYELRNIAQCDRIAILEAQIKTIMEANTRSQT